MSNLRPFRRRLAVSRSAIGKRRKARKAGRWPFGGPSLSTVRKWMRRLWLAGLVERTVEHTGKPGRPPYAYRWIGPQEPRDDRSIDDQIVDERVVTILRRARGKPLTEEQIMARYKKAMAPAEAARREQAAAVG